MVRKSLKICADEQKGHSEASRCSDRPFVPKGVNQKPEDVLDGIVEPEPAWRLTNEEIRELEIRFSKK